MSVPKEVKPEEPNPDKFASFMRLLTSIAAVPKAAIYELDPSLRPKPRTISQDKKLSQDEPK